LIKRLSTFVGGAGLKSLCWYCTSSWFKVARVKEY